MKNFRNLKVNPIELRAILKRANKRLHSAEVLIKEKEYADAVSRAYYGFFDAATAALLIRGLLAKTHAGTIMLFERHFIDTNKIPAKFARFFRQAKEDRTEADYRFLKEFTKADAEHVLKTAKEFVKVVEEMIKQEFKV